MSQRDGDILVKEFENFTKIGLTQFAFSTVESGLRVLLKAIDPQACHQGTAEFKNIYECLLRSKLTSLPADSIELLDLFRLVRNTVHNNGVFFHKSGQNATAIYKGKTYQFQQGMAINFTGFDFVISLTSDIVNLLVDVINDPAISGISGEITDPFAL